MRRTSPEAGLTLIEMLVVLAIIGIMAGVTLLSIGTGDRARLPKVEAERLASRIRLAADDVRVSQRPLALAWDARGYRFVDWDAGETRWRDDRVPQLGVRHDLPAGMSLAIDGEPRLAIASDGSGPPITARFIGRAAAWTMSFDGLNSAVAADARS